MSAAEREAGADLARRAAERQGLPSVVEDVVTLRRIAILAGLHRPGEGRRRRPPTRERRPVGDQGGVQDLGQAKDKFSAQPTPQGQASAQAGDQ